MNRFIWRAVLLLGLIWASTGLGQACFAGAGVDGLGESGGERSMAMEASAASVAYRQEMARLISDIKAYGQCIVVANGGAGLMEPSELLPLEEQQRLFASLDGIMAESVHFGYDMEMDEMVPAEERRSFEYLLGLAKAQGIVPLVLDYAREPHHRAAAYKQDHKQGYLGWVSGHWELDRLPKQEPQGQNNRDICALSEAANYLVLLNPSGFGSREQYLEALAESAYDVLILDMYFDGCPLAPAEVARLQCKPQGGKRLVLAYMSVGEAEDYRPYWQRRWYTEPPVWLGQSNPDWEGNFRVRYWLPEWRQLLMGSPESYLDTLLAAGFAGVFLDVTDVFYVYEDQSML